MNLKIALATILGAASLAAATTSQAAEASNDGKVTSLLYTCNLTFKADGKSVYLGIGYTDLYGSGTITCYDILTGQTQRQPVKVTARGPGVGLGVTGMVLTGAATGVGVQRGPENLLGHYAMVRGNAAVGVGAAVGAGLRVSNGAVNVDVSVQGQKGIGAGVDLLWINLEKEGDMRVENAPAPTAVTPAPVAVTPEPVKVNTKTIYVSEGQPVQIVDAQGRLLQTIVLKAARN